MLGSLSYKNVLERGYALVRDKNNVMVASVSGVASGEAFSVELRDGKISGIADTSGKKQTPTPARKPGKSSPDSGQGDLF